MRSFNEDQAILQKLRPFSKHMKHKKKNYMLETSLHVLLSKTNVQTNILDFFYCKIMQVFHFKIAAINGTAKNRAKIQVHFFCFSLLPVLMQKEQINYMNWVPKNKIASAANSHSIYIPPSFVRILNEERNKNLGLNLPPSGCRDI